MMRIKSLAFRILDQLRHDKRTIALVLFAPLLVLTLVYLITDTTDKVYELGIINAPKSLIQELQSDKNTLEIRYMDLNKAKEEMKNGEITAALEADENLTAVKIYTDGTNTTGTKKIQALINGAVSSVLKNKMDDNLNSLSKEMNSLMNKLKELQHQLPTTNIEIPIPDLKDLLTKQPKIEIDYVYGSADSSFFNNFGVPLIGIIVFFFVFLIAGINFLGERTSGTLEKMLSTPIKRSEIVIGYVLGFSILAMIQTTLITFYVVYVLGASVQGNILYVLLVTLLTAITALTLGLLLSTLADNEFQMLQFIPLVIIPQIFLCGLFELNGFFLTLGKFIPLHYTTEALKKVMLKGMGFQEIWYDCGVLLGCSILFMGMNMILLKKQRSI